MKLYFYFIILVLSCNFVTAQIPATKKEDSVYKRIENYSKDKSLLKFLHKMIFTKQESKENVDKQIKKRHVKLRKSFDLYESRIIRNIIIETLDPFGYSAENEKSFPQKKLEKIGNSSHLKTKNWTIKNLLLFKENDPLDSLMVKESERIIRSQRYFRSVFIKPIPIINSKDSVDISVRVLDTWSIIPKGAFSTTKINLGFTERNFFGLGHEVELNYSKSFSSKTIGYDTKYTVNNFTNTFINAVVLASKNLDDNTYKLIAINRPFYTSTARWAGGIQYNYSYFKELFSDANAVQTFQSSKIKNFDTWGAVSFKIFTGKSEFARTTNFIVATGFNQIYYLEKPSIIYDPIAYYNSSKTTLATIGIASQRFYQDKYLFRFGTIQDVPYGKVISVTGGFENKNNLNRAYIGGRFSYGYWYDFGFLEANIECGSFFTNGNTEQSTIKIEANYISDLFSMLNWKFRQFIKPSFVLGNNRLDISKDRLNLVDTNGIPGFNGTSLLGTKKIVTTFQTQSYNPKNWYGFNLSPFLNFTFGFLGDQSNRFFNPKMYSQIGIGVLINNNYLVFTNFQLSFSYYPSLPIDGSNIIKANAFQNSDIEFRNFLIERPYILPYR